jgi:acetyl-CoA synthetase
MDIVDESGAPVEPGKGGFLVVKKPWPSMVRTIWGDDERFKKTYFPEEFNGKYYMAGDSAHRDESGYFWIMGRVDDVLNVSGHRLGTMEIESALVANPLVAEAAVVGKPHEVKGEAVVAFVVLKQTRPQRGRSQENRPEPARMGQPRNRRTRQAGGHPLRRQPAENPLRQDHAPPAALASPRASQITQDVSTLENPAILQQLKEPAA